MSAASPRLPALLCLLLGLLGALPLVVLTPPLQVADEGQHFARAYQLSELRLWSRIEAGGIGDDLPTSLADFTRRFLGTTREHVTPRPVTRQPWRATLAERARPLAPQIRSFLGFQGAAYYAPFAYVPQALAIAIARALDAGPLMLLYAGRLANALAAVGLLAAAVRVMPTGKAMLMVVGLLPMTLYQDASLSPDAVMMGCAFLFIAIALRAQAHGVWRPVDVGAAIAAGTVLCSLKPVYAPLLLLGLLPDVLHKERRGRALAVHAAIVVSVAAVSLLWMRSTAFLFSQPQPGTSAHDQVAFVLRNPADYLATLIVTPIVNAPLYYQSTIGVFGWVTVRPPALLLLLPVVGALFALVHRDRPPAPASAWVPLWHLALALACFVLILTSLYVLWTPVGAPLVKGVQGRYFLPLVAVAAVAVGSLFRGTARVASPAPVRLMSLLAAVVAAQIVVSDATIVSAFSVV